MAVTFGNNILSQKAQRMLSISSDSLSTVFERLSSGQRINKASDDAAGLAIADSLNADRRVFTQGVRNFNDGISLLNIADGAINSLSNITTRLIELAEQAANGVLGTQQRKSLNEEAQALKKEYFRIVQSTEFNDRKLFTADFGELRLQGGFGVDGGIASSLGGAIGTGSFGSATSFQMEGASAHAVTLGDLNGDGILDMVTAGSGGVATVRLGDGSGSFGAATSFQMEGTNSFAVTLGDLNGDGILDMVTAGNGAGSGRATVSLGDGTGSFGAATSFQMEAGLSSAVTLGDLNGDGILDLVTAGSTGNDGYATVRLGDGSGGFGSATSFAMEGDYSEDVILGDLNGDGILDMVTAGRNAASSGGFATVRLGDGSGSFGAATSFEMSAYSSFGVTLGDLNGDGILDMVTAGSGFGGGVATVRLGDGSGSFGAATSFTMENYQSYAITLGDLNGDGILDMMTAGGDGSNGFATVRLGDGTGSFGAATSFAAEGSRSNAVSLGDLDGDGVLDLVTAGGGGRATTRLSSTTSGIAPLLDFSLETVADARQALPNFQRKLDQLSEQRGIIGAFQSRLSTGTRVLQTSAENFAAAESRIRDADIAEESSKLIRLNILQQATGAVLAQANQQPALALRLLT